MFFPPRSEIQHNTIPFDFSARGVIQILVTALITTFHSSRKWVSLKLPAAPGALPPTPAFFSQMRHLYLPDGEALVATGELPRIFSPTAQAFTANPFVGLSLSAHRAHVLSAVVTLAVFNHGFIFVWVHLPLVAHRLPKECGRRNEIGRGTELVGSAIDQLRPGTYNGHRGAFL